MSLIKYYFKTLLGNILVSELMPRFVVGKLYGIRVDLLWTPGGWAVQLAKLGHGNLVSITKNVKNSNLTLFKNVNTLKNNVH